MWMRIAPVVVILIGIYWQYSKLTNQIDELKNEVLRVEQKKVSCEKDVMMLKANGLELEQVIDEMNEATAKLAVDRNEKMEAYRKAVSKNTLLSKKVNGLIKGIDKSKGVCYEMEQYNAVIRTIDYNDDL